MCDLGLMDKNSGKLLKETKKDGNFSYVTAKHLVKISPLVSWQLFHRTKEMATHSSVLAWRIPGMGEPGGLPSMGSHRVGHN